MSSYYNRNTELRNVRTKDLYNLAVILDDDNYWQTLMEVIPQEINNQTFGSKEDLEKISSGAAYERKYSNDHIRLIENALRRPGESRLCSQILFDEWGSSGRKHERPTLGVLLHLLVQSKLYRAADFVAELLNEPKPSRPSNGPAADFEFDVDIFNDIQETVNDTRFYPNTEDLIENVNIDINRDYYTKYHTNFDKKFQTVNDNTEEPITTTAPKPPPRLLKSARLLKQQRKQNLNQTGNKNDMHMNNVVECTKQQQQLNTQLNNETILELSLSSTQNLPKFSLLMSTASVNVVPKSSPLNNISDNLSNAYEEDEDDSLNSTPSLIYTKSDINDAQEQQHPDMNSIPVVVLSKFLNADPKHKLNSNNDAQEHDLPVITHLNVNGEIDDALEHLQQNQQSGIPENIPSDSINCTSEQICSSDESTVSDDDLNLLCSVAHMKNNQNPSMHAQLESIEEDYNGIEHERHNDELEDDEDSIPNLSFLDNRSSNNESSLTSVTNTSGENSFEQSVHDCSSTSTDNVPILSALNQ